MSREEAPLVQETPGGLSVSYKGRLLYSGREPERLPRRIASSCEKPPARLFLVPSPLLWYGLPELLAAMGEGSAVLCVEADPELAALARSRLPPELASDGRLFFAQAATPSEALAAAAEIDAQRGPFRACAYLALSGGESLNAPLYRAMARAIGSEFEASWRNKAALMILGDRWAKNIFDNIAALPSMAPRPLPSLPGPVAICGAGPSLEAAMSFLACEKAEGRLSIVACDTALGTLLASGIEPDLVVCLEAQAHNLPDFTCLGSRPAFLAADLSSHPATFRAVRGPKALTLVHITRSPFLDRVEAALSAASVPLLPAPPLGSVGVHAVHVARLLSQGPFLAAGLDFSFEAGKTHARGCPSLLAEERSLGRLTRWPGQFAASFRDRTMRPFAGYPELLSDPILLSYAAILSQAGGEPLLDLRGRGPDIGGRPTSPEEAALLIREARAGGEVSGDRPDRRCRPKESGQGSPAEAGLLAGAALGLLRGERERLDALRAFMHGTRPLEEAAFRSLVEESDYLWWGFPDQDRIKDLPQDFLNRLVPQAEYWAQRLESLERSLRDPS
jgi:hypothetical protein